MSSGEVLYLSHMPVGDLSENWGIEGENAILPLSLGFVKGSARMSTLLCVLHVCSTRGCNLQMDCPSPPDYLSHRPCVDQILAPIDCLGDLDSNALSKQVRTQGLGERTATRMALQRAWPTPTFRGSCLRAPWGPILNRPPLSQGKEPLQALQLAPSGLVPWETLRVGPPEVPNRAFNFTPCWLQPQK